MVNLQLSKQYSDKMMEALDPELHTKEFILALTYLMHTAMAEVGIGKELQEEVLNIGCRVVMMEAADEL